MTTELWIMFGSLATLIVLSAFFSSAETAFSSVNIIRLKYLIQNGSKRAKHTLKLAESYEDVLTTILTGNNIVNIASASIATVVFVGFWPNYGVTISTAVMTVLVLIFGEITPKTYAKKHAEQYALLITPLLQLFIWILKPISIIFTGIQILMNRVFTFQEPDTVSEDELLTYVSEVQQEGGINENEEEMIRSVIDFDDLKVEDILTPRVRVIAISDHEDTKAIIHTFRHSGYSRLPVYDTSIDHIIGTINHKDFYNLVVLENQSLSSIISPPVFVTEYMKATDLLSLLRENKVHMAIVKDEFGGTIGIVTMEDILEEIVGEIWDEHDTIVESIVKVTDKQYRVKGYADIDIFFETLDLPEDDEMDVATVNGWVVDQFGHIPFIGESFHNGNLNVTVTGADTKKVLEVIVDILDFDEELEEDIE